MFEPKDKLGKRIFTEDTVEYLDSKHTVCAIFSEQEIQLIPPTGGIPFSTSPDKVKVLDSFIGSLLALRDLEDCKALLAKAEQVLASKKAEQAAKKPRKTKEKPSSGEIVESL